MKTKSILLATALSIATLASTARATTSNIEAPVHSVMTVTSQEEEKQTLLEEQLKMLGQGIVPSTSEETINTWAKAIQMPDHSHG